MIPFWIIVLLLIALGLRVFMFYKSLTTTISTKTNVDLINELSTPPKKITADNAFTRGMNKGIYLEHKRVLEILEKHK